MRFISKDKSFEGSIFLVEIICFISEAASIPTSDLIKNSSILFKFSSSFFYNYFLNARGKCRSAFLKTFFKFIKNSHYNFIEISLISETGPFI